MKFDSFTEEDLEIKERDVKESEEKYKPNRNE